MLGSKKNQIPDHPEQMKSVHLPYEFLEVKAQQE